MNVVKKIIEIFVEENVDKNIEIYNKAGEKILTNSSIFEIECFLVELRNKFEVNERLDTTIFSNNIITNFNSIEASGAYNPIDYQLNFLNHLAENFKNYYDLYMLIDTFIERFKHEFTLADIVITKSGVTRCKTNIRFALNGLRELGLVLSRDKNDKRSWEPSILGLITLLNIKFNTKNAETWKNYKSVNSFWINNISNETKKLNPNKFLDKNLYDPTLLNSLNQLKDNDYLYEYLDKHWSQSLNQEEKKVIEGVIKDYIDFIEGGLEIQKEGVRKNKLFDELSKKFQANLFNTQKDNYELHGKLYAHFQPNKNELTEN